MIYKKWWFWVVIVCILAALGNLSETLENQNIGLNEQEIEQSFDDTNQTAINDNLKSNDNNIDHNIIGTWINQKSTHILEKLILLEDGTGFWDSSAIYWGVNDNTIVFKFTNKIVDYGYKIENSKLCISNGCQLIKIDDKQPIKLASLLNTRWTPDFVSYPNNYHVDNPTLKLVYVSIDEKNLIFTDEKGASYAAKTDNGWRYFFEDDELFYAFSLRGLDPEEGYDVPTMFVDVTNGGWYTVIYKPEE